MVEIEIKEADALQACKERKSHPSPIVRDRMHMLYLLWHSFDRGQCALILNISTTTVTQYVRMYNEGGLDRLRQLNYHGHDSEMDQHMDSIKKDLKAIKPRTVKEAKEHISSKYGIERSTESVRRFLHRGRLKYRKTNPFPGGPDKIDEHIKGQEDFVRETIKPLTAKALQGESDLLFMDAAHFVQGKFEAHLWSEEVMFAPTSHGRYRVNVIGGLDIVGKRTLSMYNDSYISAPTIVEYLTWLRGNHFKDKERELNILLDNARYQKCKLVTEAATALNINLINLPAYSPNLNLIERLWKVLKKEMGKLFLQKKEEFKEAIKGLLAKINTSDFEEKIKGVFSLKFQKYKKSQILTW